MDIALYLPVIIFVGGMTTMAIGIFYQYYFVAEPKFNALREKLMQEQEEKNLVLEHECLRQEFYDNNFSNCISVGVSPK